MKPEFIYAIESSTVEKLLPLRTGHMDFCPAVISSVHEMAKGLILGRRDRLETNESYRQIIPYIALQRQDGAILTYRRTSSSSEARLIDSVSVGFGGHIDLMDGYIGENQTSLLVAIVIAATREMKEELDFDISGMTARIDQLFKGYIVDDSTPVGRVHLGCAIVIPVSMSGAERIASNESHVDLVDWLTPAQLLENDGTRFNLEPWSKLIIEALNEE